MDSPLPVSGSHFPPKGVKMLLLSGIPVTRFLTKMLEPLTLLNK
jgi:hypothetical protein